MTYILQQNNTTTSPVFTEGAHLRTSDKYKFQSTDKLITRFVDQGFTISGITESRTRNPENKGYQKHIVVMENPEFTIDDNNRFQLLLTNSHLGNCSLKINLGIYRTICSNGLVVGNSMFEAIIPHVGKEFYSKVDIAIARLFESLPTIRKTVKLLMSTEVSDTLKINKFIQSVTGRILGKKDNLISVDFQSYNPRRKDDVGNNAFTLFNRIQEVTIKGGLKYVTRSVDKTGNVYFRNNTTREVKSIDRLLDLNKFCWDKANELLLAG